MAARPCGLVSPASSRRRRRRSPLRTAVAATTTAAAEATAAAAAVAAAAHIAVLPRRDIEEDAGIAVGTPVGARVLLFARQSCLGGDRGERSLRTIETF